MPEQSTNSQNKDYQKVSAKEFFEITRWSTKFLFKVQPVSATIFLISKFVARLQEIGNNYIFALLIDALIKTLRDANGGAPDISKMYPYVGIAVGYSVFNSIVSLINNMSVDTIRNYGRPKAKQLYYKKLQDLGLQNLEQPEFNNKIHRAEGYLDSLISFPQQFINFLSYVLKAISALLVVVYFFPAYSIAIVLLTIPWLLFDRKFRKEYYSFLYESTEGRRRAGASLSDLTNPYKFNENFITKTLIFLDKKYMEYQIWSTKKSLGITRRWQTGGTFIDTLSDLAIFAGYLQIFKSFFKGLISIGDVTFRVRSITTAKDAVTSAFSYYNDLTQSATQLKDAYTLFNTGKAFPDGTVVLPKLSQGPEIRLSDVTFRYPNTNKDILRGLDLKIKSGEKIAIVGPNGAGKTTIVKLICRIYQVTSGELLINNTNINELKVDNWYDNIGVLFQEFNMYHQLTVKENIYLGKSDEPVDEIAIRLAAQQADATSFIEEYPKKFDQVLSEKFEGGIRPSTGQWQKLAIARFFYRNAPLVIFDEPTASIDAVSEYNIFNRIYDFFKGKTVIIISHRFSTVRNADRIIVVDKGQIIEEGTHDHLMSLNGKYAEAFLLQARGYSNETN
ncbi:MAG: hypothetical protein ACD_22C00094G0007 [uncultured bacterium]|nr:MAG: hypothetical protein ACD_22C00094G0007 [uncultured bacterium]